MVGMMLVKGTCADVDCAACGDRGRPGDFTRPIIKLRLAAHLLRKRRVSEKRDLLRLRGSPKPTDVTVDGPGGDTPC